MTDRVFVDTNIWVYTVDRRDPAKRAKALAAVSPTAGREVIVSTQVLTEFYSVVTNKLALPLAADVARALVQEMSRLATVSIDGALVADALVGCRDWGVSVWDALIIRAAESAGCPVVLSEDLAHGRRYGSVTVINPLLDSA